MTDTHIGDHDPGGIDLADHRQPSWYLPALILLDFFEIEVTLTDFISFFNLC